MTRYRIRAAGLLAISFGLIAATPAWAASPTKVTADWKGGVSGLPSDVSMYSYVPAKVATNPPLLTLIHYCGGSATAVFGQASGLVSAADQYGFVIVVPDNGGRCWDVTSSKTHTRDGGGDSHAIIQMVRYALTQYHANADRVYSTGDSSGAMMTELLLALYPDIYKAGSTFAGVPAGCSNEFDGSGLCGLPAQTAQQWGDRVRAMDSGYSGHRPRVQLFHGDADPTITYKNQAEAIKEWTNVLGLNATPTSTDTGLTLGNHQATRQRWLSSCGYAVLEAFTSIGGDHGPSDALFVAQYVVPFLGLDKTGATDPEIAQCGSTGTGGSGGSPDGGTGGNAGSGGAGGNKDGGGSGGSSGNKDGGSGGAAGSGGALGNGGATGGGGSAGGGGTSGRGGTDGTGGISSSGGNSGGAGTSGSGGTSSSGGMSGSGGISAKGGSGGSGGSSGTGGTSGSGGSTATAGGTTSGGCSCGVGKSAGTGKDLPLFLLAALALALRRRRKRTSPAR